MASDDAANLAERRPVWMDDVTVVVPEVSFLGRAVWSCAAWLGCGIAILVISWWQDAEFVEWLAWPVGIGSLVAIVFGATFWIKASRLRRWLTGREQAPPHTHGELAWRIWHRQMADTSPRPRLNVAQWLDLSGPDGPRIISIDAPLPSARTAGDATEEVAVGADRTLGSGERKALFLQLLAFVPSMACLVWFVTRRPSGFLVFLYAVYGAPLIMSIGIAYRLGFRPVTLNRASAIPGMVRVAGLRGTQEFRREDSVLLLQNAAKGIVAMMHRRDGATWKVRFNGGANDPAYAELLERWSWPGRSATPADIAPRRSTT